MPSIVLRIQDLHPNTCGTDSNQRSTWFSYVRRTYTREHGGTVEPPTMSEFMRELGALRPDFTFYSEGSTLDQAKQSLAGNNFQSLPRRPRYIREDAWNKKLKIITFVRAIIAFNAYARIRRELGTTPNHNVDFIGAASDSHMQRNTWEPRFHGRCVLYLADSKLNHLIELVINDRQRDFWLCIMELYDAQRAIRQLQNPQYARGNDSRPRQPGPTPQVARTAPRPTQRNNTVDQPTSRIAEEYLNRGDEVEEDVIPNTAQIAAMIARSGVELPRDFRKIMFEVCVAAQMSHPLEQVPETAQEATVIDRDTVAGMLHAFATSTNGEFQVELSELREYIDQSGYIITM